MCAHVGCFTTLVLFFVSSSQISAEEGGPLLLQMSSICLVCSHREESLSGAGIIGCCTASMCAACICRAAEYEQLIMQLTTDSGHIFEQYSCIPGLWTRVRLMVTDCFLGCVVRMS